MNKRRIRLLSLYTIGFLLLALLLRMLFPAAEFGFYDRYFAGRARSSCDPVVIVGIDRHTLRETGAFPWPRSTMAGLVESIQQHEPRGIALTTAFPKRPSPAQNDSLAAVFSRVPHLVLPFMVGDVSEREQAGPQFVPIEALPYRISRIENEDQLQGSSFYAADVLDLGQPEFIPHVQHAGFVNVATTLASKRLRQVIQVVKVGGAYFPSLALASAAAYLDADTTRLILDGKGVIRVDDRPVPITPYAASTFINFRGPSGSVKTISAQDVLEGRADPSVLKDKLVFVGLTDPSTAPDIYTTPVDPQLPGVEIWATAALDILSGTYVKKDSPALFGVELLVALLIFPGVVLVFSSRRKMPAAIAAAALVAISLVAGFLLFNQVNLYWNPILHVFALGTVLVWGATYREVHTAPGEADEEKVSAGDLDLDTSLHEDQLNPPPPSPGDFLTGIPDMQTAEHVAERIEASAPLMDITAEASTEGTEESEDAAQGEDQRLIEDFSKLAGGRIVRPLGSGGMADVYLIWNPRMEVYRAVKVLKPDMPERLLDRFETEIRIFSSLNHANIVQCYSVGEWYSLPYLEMEYVPGTAMDELLTMLGRLTPSQVCAIGILVCRALDYAHNQNVTVYGKTYRGVIHRDLKPANILLGHNGLVKLTDFGIARPTEVGLHTMDTHKVVGTLPYLAPEQCQGQEITALTDVYALGETLYELASGQRAFPQSDIMTCATAKTKGRIEPLADSLELPCGLVEVIDRSLAVKPEERFSSAGDMGRHLERVFRGIVKGDSRKVLPGLARHYWGERQNPEAPTGGAET